MRWQQENHVSGNSYGNRIYSGPILDHVGVRYHLGFLAGALLLLLSLPGKVTAQAYTIPIPDSGAGTAFYTASVSAGPGWDVTIDFDTDHCELHCAYRRKPSQIPLVARLLPPVATIKFYKGSASKPETVIVDPAGITNPAIEAQTVPEQANLCLPGRRLVAAGSFAGTPESIQPGSPRLCFAKVRTLSSISSPLLPLRI